ncbi:sulfatase-like hydrolase/transferase [Allorhodopirellula solitaria]|nr:sulfatase-like hydrolase/transferase [Allorhodopirellula solitaria]
MFVLVVLHPLGAPLSSLGLGEMVWIGAQCVLLQFVPLSIAVAWSVRRPAVAAKYGPYLFVGVPIGFAVDVVVFRSSGMHFFSADFAELARNHLPRLMAFFSWGMLVPLLAIGGYVGIGLVLSKHCGRLAVRNEQVNRVCHAISWGLLVIAACGAVRWLTFDPIERMAVQQAHATRHPFYAVPWSGAPMAASAGGIDHDRSIVKPVEPFTFDRNRFAGQVSGRIQQMRMNVVVETDSDGPPDARPDILIVVCESLRSEMLAPDVMPHTFAAAQSGWWLKQHFSGGNATSLGMFSLVSGLESIWFYRSQVRFAPALNRLFRQAGYELGFFAGHDDWRAFQMDAFLSPEQFDRYEIEPMDWLESDRRSIARVKRFLRNRDLRPLASPRLAILFLYSTHMPFAVDDAQAMDQPSASADYPIPFPESWRESVWNRYRNAARTLDAELAGLFHEEAVVVLVGDHGESFLDDGTVGHGTKLSHAQTQTAAMVTGPGVPSRPIHARTMHADILPTLLAIAGIDVSMPDQFDGVDLGAATEETLRSRIFSISNLVGRNLVLLPPAERRSRDGWGTRVEFSLLDNTIQPHGKIDRNGDPIGPPDEDRLRDWMKRIVR